LRLICDANIGTRLVDAFAAARHDVVRSIRALTPTASDEAILAYAVAEQRVLITCDSDFGELIFLKGQLPLLRSSMFSLNPKMYLISFLAFCPSWTPRKFGDA
jgi:predicted nuclease of predicted toxin-antitoxin system